MFSLSLRERAVVRGEPLVGSHSSGLRPPSTARGGGTLHEPDRDGRSARPVHARRARRSQRAVRYGGARRCALFWPGFADRSRRAEASSFAVRAFFDGGSAGACRPRRKCGPQAGIGEFRAPPATMGKVDEAGTPFMLLRAAVTDESSPGAASLGRPPGPWRRSPVSDERSRSRCRDSRCEPP